MLELSTNVAKIDSKHFIFKGLSLETFEDFELKLLFLFGTAL